MTSLSFCIYLENVGGNPGLVALWEEEKQRRRLNNEPSQIEKPESQGSAKV